MLAQERSVGSIVIGNDYCVLVNADIAFESVEKIAGQVLSIPIGYGLPQLLPEHMNTGLCDESHGHVSIADIEVEDSCPMPTKSLVGIEKLFAVPTFWVVLK
jgi:hypothetical protein